MLRRTLAVLLTIIAVLAAGWLALHRADVPYDTLETAYSLPDSQFMTLDDGLKVHYTDTGPKDRSVLVLVHGFSSSLHTWSEWKRDLEADYRVITLDLPGHGLTRVDEEIVPSIERFVDVVDEVTERLEVRTFTLVGNSMGGATTWNYALAHPEKLEGMVLIAASGWPPTDEEAESSPMVFKLMQNPVARLLLKDLDVTSLTRSGLEDSYTDQSFVTDELVQRYVSLSRAPGHREALLSISANIGDRPEASAANLSTIAIPSLVVWGRDDNLVPVSHAQNFSDALPGSRLVIYDGVGHLPQEEAAEGTISELRSFMLDVEWGILEEEEIVPAGDPRLVEDRPTTNGG